MDLKNLNKNIVVDFYSKVLGQGDENFAATILQENYIQHSPTVKTGKKGFMEFLSLLKGLPKSLSQKPPFMRFVCDSDLVAVHLNVEFMGQARAVVDLFRIKDGRLAEHWDAWELIPGEPKNDNAAVEGPVPTESLASTQENKRLINLYTEQVLIQKQWDLAGEYLEPGLIQHNPGIADGQKALETYYKTAEVIKMHKVIGEGDFVLTQSSGKFGTLPHVVYDIYRLANGRIVEHWSVKQEIPTEMAHSNGMVG